MKIIDLLNMIAKGEEMPKRIKYNGEILEYNNATQDYEGISKTGTGDFFDNQNIILRAIKQLDNKLKEK